jgi:hypothetical protein
MSELLVPNLYQHMAIVLEKMRSSVGAGGTFDAAEFAREYESMYPEDREVKQANGLHSLEGYLGGMLWEYFKKAKSDKSFGPTIEKIGSKLYRFAEDESR